MFFGLQLKSSDILPLTGIFFGGFPARVVHRSAYIWTARTQNLGLLLFDSVLSRLPLFLSRGSGYPAPYPLLLQARKTEDNFVNILVVPQVVDWGLSSGQKLQQAGNSFSSIVLSVDSSPESTYFWSFPSAFRCLLIYIIF